MIPLGPLPVSQNEILLKSFRNIFNNTGLKKLVDEKQKKLLSNSLKIQLNVLFKLV